MSVQPVRQRVATQYPVDIAKAWDEIEKIRRGITTGARLRTIVKVFAKHGLLSLLQDMNRFGKKRPDQETLRLLGRRLRLAFEELGPTFIKLGQVLVTRQEILPDEITSELAKLLDEVPPLPFSYMAAVLERELPEGLSTFRWIEEEPIGSASLAQVYRAELWDGQKVAVKIVRPTVGKYFETDIKVIRRLVKFIQKRLPSKLQAVLNLPGLIDDYYSSAISELDMNREASNMAEGARLAEQFERVRLAKVFAVTKSVLITEYVEGWTLKEFPVDFLTFEERMLLMVDLSHLYIASMLEGLYHADAHASNILLDKHTKEAVVIDWGMVGRMDAVHTEAIFRMLMHLRLNQAEDATEAAMDIFEPTVYTSTVKVRDEFRTEMIKYVSSPQGDSRLNWGAMVMNLIRIALANYCRIPAGLALWTKGWSATEGTARWLCPELSYHHVVETADIQILRAWMQRRFNYRATAATVNDLMKLVTTLPRRINKILEHLYWNNMKVTVENKMETTTAQLVNRGVNRVAVALLAAALYLGTPQMAAMATQEHWPAGTVHFLSAAGTAGSAACMVYLVWKILRSNKR